MRVTSVMTHPIQYYSPWYRWIAEHRPDVELTVLYAAVPEAEQQGRAFGRAFEWDVPLTEGYPFEVCADAAGMDFGYESFFGVDVADIGARIAATRPDVVLLAGWHSAFQVRALLACRRLGIPAIYRGDTNLTGAPPGWRRAPWVLRTRVLLHGFSGWLSVGTRASAYLERFGVPEPLRVRSPHSADHDWFMHEAARVRAAGGRSRLRAAAGIAPDAFALLFAGRAVEIKRPLDAVRCAAGLGEGIVLVVAGDGPLLGQMRREAERLHGAVAFLGFRNQREMVEAYAMSDALLVPSTTETWCFAVNEALASGVPCVVSDGVGAGDDLIRAGLTGEVFPAADIAAMVQGVETVRQGLRAGRYSPAACQDAVRHAGFREAADGLVQLATRVRARRPGPPGHPRVIACCGNMASVFGLERMTFEVLGALAAYGASVRCVVNRWGSSAIVDRAAAIGASWTFGYYWYDVPPRGGLAALLRSLWDVGRTSAGLLREAVRCRPTHVFVPEYSAALRNAPALLLLRAAGVTVIARLGNAPEDRPIHRRMWRWAIGPLVSRFVANSQFTAAALVQTGVSPAKVSVVHNAAPSRPATTGSPGVRDPGLVVFVGQVIPPKGVRELLEAVALLRAAGRDVRLDVVGDIDGWEPPAWQSYRAGVRARAAQPDLAGHVRFLGLREDVPALMAAAGVHCCPSQPEQREAFGLVNLEAKLAGTPSVVTPFGAVREIVEHGVDGWIADDGSPEALARALDQFVADPARARQAGERARLSASRFSMERFVVSWLQVFGVAGGGVAGDRRGATVRSRSHAR